MSDDRTAAEFQRMVLDLIQHIELQNEQKNLLRETICVMENSAKSYMAKVEKLEEHASTSEMKLQELEQTMAQQRQQLQYLEQRGCDRICCRPRFPTPKVTHCEPAASLPMKAMKKEKAMKAMKASTKASKATKSMKPMKVSNSTKAMKA